MEYGNYINITSENNKENRKGKFFKICFMNILQDLRKMARMFQNSYCNRINFINEFITCSGQLRLIPNK